MKNRRSEKLTLWIISHKSILLLLITVISSYCLWQIRSVEFADDVSSYVDGSQDELQSFLAETKKFGNYETYVFVVRADDVLVPGVIKIIRALTALLESDLDVSRVVSLTNLPIEPLGDGVQDAILSGRDREALLRNPFLSENILMPDGGQTQVLVLIDASEVDGYERLSFARRLREYAADLNTTEVRIDVTGPSIIAIDAMDISERDFKRVVWLVPLILGVIVLLVFQGHLIVFAPVLIVVTAILWTVGLFTATGNKLTMMTTLMPVIISVITFSDVIHILHKYYCEASESHSTETVVLRTMVTMNIACFMTSITTAIGFIALLAVSSISVVKLFTFWTAVGVMISYALTIVTMPIVLLKLPLPGENARQRYRTLPLNRLINACYRFSLRPRSWILLLWLLMPFLFLWGSFQSSVQTDISRFLPEDSPSIETFHLLRSGVDGVDSLEVVIDAEKDTFRGAEQVLALVKLQEGLASKFGEIRSVHSLTDAIAGLHVFAGNSGFPDGISEIEEYVLVVELTADEDWLRSFSTEDFGSVRVSLRIEHEDSRRTLALINEIDTWLVANTPPEWRVRTTGTLKLLVVNVQSLVDSQLLSFLLALSIITLVIFLFVRNWMLSGFSLIVNIIPVLVALGLLPLLAWSGLLGAESTSLNISTVMVPSLAMAIAVDDTIHFLFRFRAEQIGGASVQTAVKGALSGAGFAMTVTTIAMVLGFSALLFSEIRANQEFAAMMCIAFVAALLADLLLLPLLIQKWMAPSHVR